ncbi:isocitrate/isopropylmalate family dehydrogenase [Urbifossiella limnaea]|uniref:Isocitrate dehydrogenase [NADP] n=1 Tax=Urbifossiella limnaea TaxID=2528023 RepID=A0A517XS08_9BACT|nr:isocitrate/isopropylmalate family dehydrogenase [Urbifossiella limnaea]QDU20300.1 Isocitrate dehydrogenase [NADP] [Urbifossiella limnaea]
MHSVVFVQGGGVGVDQELAVRRILDAAGVSVQFEVVTAGRAALEQGLDALPESVFAAVRARGVALKTKLLTQKGAAPPTNYNVAFRRQLGLHTSVRPVRNLGGLASRFRGVNFLLVREISEDLYTASEHELVPGVVQSFKIVTAATSLRFFRFAFELARRTGRKSVHCIHKANILKMADGLFLDCFRRVAADFPDIAAKDLIVDNTCMQLVSRPQQFEVMAAGNLYGDLLSDLGAGLVGGVSATAAVNHGDGVTVYEAVYGAGHEMVPKDKANPLPLVLPAVEMLRDLGEAVAADRIVAAVEGVLTDGQVRTADIGGTATTTQFTDAIVARLR